MQRSKNDHSCWYMIKLFSLQPTVTFAAERLAFDSEGLNSEIICGSFWSGWVVREGMVGFPEF